MANVLIFSGALCTDATTNSRSCSAAPLALRDLGDPSPSPSPDLLWNLVALASFMRLSLLKGSRAASSSAARQVIRVPGWADVWGTGPTGLGTCYFFVFGILAQTH
jgi:hypothetical protein